ncbi:MAG: MBL fold metallo-hydrolase, partial [Candidatus Doudnabacteria bacterium]|nr:MBL fold metallo-hydrolase [Candidatus Doudnabacteria bacterium]
MNFQIEFLGAAGTVTGSCYLVTAGDVRFIVDCGMWQGPDVEKLNLEEFNFNPATVDFVLLTHTHIDHSGMLPKLVKGGFNGPIYATPHTAQLVPILLLDSAKIQESNYKEGKPWKHAQVVAMVYGTQDAENTIALLQTVRLDETFSPANGISVKYIH